MAFTLADIRVALKAQLEANLTRETNIDVYGENMPPPSIVVELANVPTYNGSYKGLSSAPFVLRIIPGNADGSAVIRLDDYLSAGTGNNSSVIDALRAAGPLKDIALHVQIEPGSYDPEAKVAELLVTVAVNKSAG